MTSNVLAFIKFNFVYDLFENIENPYRLHSIERNIDCYIIEHRSKHTHKDQQKKSRKKNIGKRKFRTLMN